MLTQDGELDVAHALIIHEEIFGLFQHNRIKLIRDF